MPELTQLSPSTVSDTPTTLGYQGLVNNRSTGRRLRADDETSYHDKPWVACNDQEKLEKLRDACRQYEDAMNSIRYLRSRISILESHSHDVGGRVVIPIHEASDYDGPKPDRHSPLE